MREYSGDVKEGQDLRGHSRNRSDVKGIAKRYEGIYQGCRADIEGT